MTETETKPNRYIFACMMGQERSADLQSLAREYGYTQSELLAGGLLTISKEIVELFQLAGFDEYENVFDFINNIKIIVAQHPNLLDHFEAHSSHSIYFKHIFTDMHDNFNKKFVVTIDDFEVEQVQLGLALLSVYGEVFIGEFKDVLRAIVTKSLDDFLSDN